MPLNDILVLQDTARFYDVLHRVFNLINYHTGKACAEILAILIYVTFILRYIFYSLKSVISNSLKSDFHIVKSSFNHNKICKKVLEQSVFWPDLNLTSSINANMMIQFGDGAYLFLSKYRTIYVLLATLSLSDIIGM
jgi:hypothetical protein